MPITLKSGKAILETAKAQAGNKKPTAAKKAQKKIAKPMKAKKTK